MKKVMIMSIFVFMVIILVNTFQIRKVEAKTKPKSNVVCTLKNRTLTVKGKGAMTKKTVLDSVK